MGAAPVLTILRNGETVRSLQLDGEAMLGRSEGCVIRLDDRAISRQHALFRRIGDVVQVEKKSEFAPLSVNGSECTKAVLKDLCDLRPTGALFHKGMTVAEMERDRSRLEFIVNAREKKLWIAPD